MNDKQLTGVDVVSTSDGEKLGQLERAYADPITGEIVGFAFKEPGGFLRPESSPMIDATEVDTLGPDVLAIASRAAVRGAATSARYTELVGLDELTRRQVLTEGGMSLGHVVGVEFDEETFQLTGLEIGAGLFKKPTVIPFEQVLTVGADVVVVRDEVASDDPAADASAGSAAVGRPAPVEGVAFREETFDVPLRAEELIVEKQVRVAEEIEISKEAFERTVSTAGSVRREQVHLTERAIVETPDAAETPSADEAAEGEHRES